MAYQPVPTERSYGGTDQGAAGGPTSKRLQQTQAQVDEICAGLLRHLPAHEHKDFIRDMEQLKSPKTSLRYRQVLRDKVVDIMKTNVDKVLERDQKLSELDDRADALQQGASQFETQAAKLKRKYWWKNCKMWAILIVVILVVLIIIIVSVVTSSQN